MYRAVVIKTNRVGHMFRSKKNYQKFKGNFPYSFPKGNEASKNKWRLAEVWLDQEFREKCFEKKYGKRSNSLDIGDLSGEFPFALTLALAT